MVLRKLISAFGATGMMVMLLSVLDQSGVGLFFGMYILPIVLIYGIPSSIFTDFLTRRTGGLKRRAAAGLLHVFLGALFVLIPTLLFDAGNGNWLTNLRNNGFFFFTAVVSAFIFWRFDEALKSEWCGDLRRKCLGILKRIGAMRI
ncbi:hypothetical protein [Mesobacillus selenatarsenatis]|uniref:Uncharacterized protein n=1 Tax=Mesobacillus selenatarsenatis (strain DSM 18680 / JCM 14380 / FERM P-15431 / SF-1) TaxID=1321606 RepID=A0A0A8WXH2_MESS1|nr:hypothetical protein [Mesobacillus selenatarsenatis]GAM12328.1 hypothetical protein SAMD00020551_0460 [Mesobacillus selenatarsenatis SF-1]